MTMARCVGASVKVRCSADELLLLIVAVADCCCPLLIADARCLVVCFEDAQQFALVCHVDSKGFVFV